MTVHDIRQVLVVGTGFMGQKIALQCACCGYDVVAYDPVPQALKNAREKIPALAEALVEQGKLTPTAVPCALQRILYTSRPEDGAEADLLSESALEDVEIKAKVFAQFNQICRPEALFTTNTSTLLPSMYAEATGRPAQFAALHFYGVFERPLVDIMPHAKTSPATLDILVAFARRIKQQPLIFKKERPGYVANAVFDAMTAVAFKIALVEKSMSLEDVDRAVMLYLGMPCGPFGLNDHVGLDTIWHVMCCKAQMTGDADLLRFTEQFRRDYIDTDRLGVKSARGFYSYPDPAYQRAGFLDGDTAAPALLKE